MKDSKNLVIGMLCAVVCIMAVAYAAFSTTLNINGTATISSEWAVAYEASFADCELHSAAGTTEEGVAKGVTASVTRVSDTVATVNMSFAQPGDYAICTINVVNNGDIDAKLNFDTTGTTKTELVEFTLTGTDTANAPLNANGQHTITVKGEFLDKKVEGTNDSVAITDSNKTASLSIVTTATQNLG